MVPERANAHTVRIAADFTRYPSCDGHRRRDSTRLYSSLQGRLKSASIATHFRVSRAGSAAPSAAGPVWSDCGDDTAIASHHRYGEERRQNHQQSDNEAVGDPLRYGRIRLGLHSDTSFGDYNKRNKRGSRREHGWVHRVLAMRLPLPHSDRAVARQEPGRLRPLGPLYCGA